MGLNCNWNTIGNGNTIAEKIIVKSNFLKKEEYMAIIERNCNNYYNREITSYRRRLHNIVLEALDYHDWTPEEEQQLFSILGDTSESLEERVSYYKAAIDILPGTSLYYEIKKMYVKCKIIKFIRELLNDIFPQNN
ncbi:hypothetical protein FUSNEC_GEN_294_01595 [Fusobacterium necrophorum subsp. funduliforme]|uniref:hypothetical protein n=1 Tax=Fusobacterium necrophorum TaxID=859 RepID=UPI0007872D35|nr:hypothetical protein [Fusobacterium necrophorum]AVQ20687.1 hypothetical protein C4N15_03130 [Fusobacterium necrophorum subsp. funduliforme]AYV94368.1 hypothetical protein BWX37_01510 [Fusobacterium necrophorum subsp. funduliforme]KYL04283.1 hypothetical protein A2J06_01375 [Fusobacterium necrophorum subsp. funduliforme]MCI7343697.1 hypothetical protein [Fusobacterium necrophorum]MDK4472375.1 hypothetical protein [Fusobacterium necrophorum]